MVSKRIAVIDGMELETAGKDVALRKEIDGKLFEIENLGKVIEVLCTADVAIHRDCLGSVATVISREANEVWRKLDDFLAPYYLELDLKERKV